MAVGAAENCFGFIFRVIFVIPRFEARYNFGGNDQKPPGQKNDKNMSAWNFSCLCPTADYETDLVT